MPPEPVSPAPGPRPADAQPRPAGTALAYLVSRYPAVSHTFIQREVQGLRALGLHIEVASVNPPDRSTQRMTADERHEAASTYGLKADGLRGAAAALVWALRRRPRGLLHTLAQAWSLGRGARRVRALAYAVEAVMVSHWMARRGLQHLHVHFGNEAATVGMLTKTLAGTGLSITIHGPDEFDNVPGQHLRLKIAAADQVVCISQFARSQLMRLSPPAQWGKLQLCRLGVDPAAHDPLLRRSSWAAEQGPVRLLCVGRLAPAKGQWLLLQACARLARDGLDFHLTLVGDGPDRADLHAEAQRLGLGPRVQFTGALNQAEVQAQLALADAFVLPSLAEGIPVVLMEAMASGLPCLSSPVNGIPELIRHERDGLLASPGDLDALTLQLRRLVLDRALRRRLALAGPVRVQQAFHLGANVAQLARIFARLPARSALPEGLALEAA